MSTAIKPFRRQYMVYFKDWDAFFTESQRMFIRSPEKTRYSFKYRGKNTTLVLTVTDDTKTLKFKTDQRSDRRKMEALTEWMLFGMTSPQSTAKLQEQFSFVLEPAQGNAN